MEFLTIPEAAERLKVSTRTISRYISSGKLKATRISQKTVRVKESDLLGMTNNPNNAAAVLEAIEEVREELPHVRAVPTESINKSLSDIETALACYNAGAGFEGYEEAAFNNALLVHGHLGSVASARLVAATPKRMENVSL
jgi:excisionase family DNA binding protein